ncbi:MAG: SpoIIE family protein phosphatase [Desulfobacteraceae bacterium]|nr:SpoIIE family protein phosphatase [Desulfobacteraceae bacterium]
MKKSKSSLSISAKLNLIFFLIVFIMGSTSLFIYHFTKKQLAVYDQILGNFLIINKIPAMVAQTSLDLQTYQNNASDKLKKNIRKKTKQLNKWAAIVKNNTYAKHKNSLYNIEGIIHMLKELDKNTGIVTERIDKQEYDEMLLESMDQVDMIVDASKETVNKYVSEELENTIILRKNIVRKNKILETSSLLITAGSMVLSIILLYFFLSKGIILPVTRIAESVRIIASGHLDRAVHSERNDEIGQLASDVEKMRLAINDLTENLGEQERMKSELEIAKKIQTVLLPKSPEISGYDISVSMEPSEEVGGDYYDFISVGEYDWIVIGDVSGHGLTAGLVMMMVRTAIHTVLLGNPEMQPAHLLSEINKTIYQNIEKMDESKHMTIVVLAGRDGIFTFTGLHEDILIRRSGTGKVDAIETNGMWLGIEPDISSMLHENTVKMEPGDCMVLFTDGITEARDGKDIFGQDELIKIIEESGNSSASVIHDNIIHAIKYYEKPDDVTLAVLRRLERKNITGNKPDS